MSPAIRVVSMFLLKFKLTTRTWCFEGPIEPTWALFHRKKFSLFYLRFHPQTWKVTAGNDMEVPSVMVSRFRL